MPEIEACTEQTDRWMWISVLEAEGRLCSRTPGDGEIEREDAQRDTGDAVWIFLFLKRRKHSSGGKRERDQP